jgi:hypothetical protein
MSHGNLEGKVVAFDFWPACENCRLFEACKVKPCHPAYPHSWHWGREFAAFADGYLITRSWVGTAAIGQPHTGCTSYKVDPQHVNAPQIHHRLYLDLEQEKENLETEMAALESKKTWTRNDEEFHAALLGRFRRILQKQEVLRSSIADTRPQAVAVNE